MATGAAESAMTSATRQARSVADLRISKLSFFVKTDETWLRARRQHRRGAVRRCDIPVTGLRQANFVLAGDDFVTSLSQSGRRAAKPLCESRGTRTACRPHGIVIHSDKFRSTR